MNSSFAKLPLYRLTLYFLSSLLFLAFIFSFFGLLPVKPLDIFLSTIIILPIGVISSYFFADMFEVKTRIESVLIMLIILILIFPIKFPANIWLVMLGSFFAVASKYLLTVERRHIFNPVAVAAVAVALLYPEAGGAVWWIGAPVMIPFIVLGGILILIKLRASGTVSVFLLTYLGSTALGSLLHGGSWQSIFHGWQIGLFHSALLFFALVMLTEPLTSPANRTRRTYFAILVALLYSTIQLRLFGVSLAPETALCLGNIYAYLVRPSRVTAPLAAEPQIQN